MRGEVRRKRTTGRIARVGLVDGVLRLVQKIFGLIFPWDESHWLRGSAGKTVVDAVVSQQNDVGPGQDSIKVLILIYGQARRLDNLEEFGMNDLEKLDLLHLLEYLVLNCFVGGIVACMSSSTLLEMGRCVPGPYGSILLLGWIQQLIWKKTWYMIRDETVFIPSVIFIPC